MSSPRDSISSASSYYNNQYRVDPGFARGCREIQKRELKDTLETKQQRLERQLQTQFNLNQQVPSGKIVLFAQVGKYAILALVMPPFYLFYEGPRWILITIQPLFLVAFEKAGAFLLLISTFNIDFWAGLGKKLQFFKKPKDIIKEKFKNFSNAISKRVEILGLKLYSILQPLGQMIEKWKSYRSGYQEKKASFVHFLKILPRLLKRKIDENKEQWKTTLKEKAAALIALLKPIQIPFAAIQKILQPVAAFVRKQTAILFKPMFKASAAVVTASKTVAKKLIEQFKVLGNLLAIPFNIAFEKLEAPYKKTVKYVESIAATLKKKVIEQQENLVKYVKIVALPLQKGFAQVGNAAIKTTHVLKRLQKVQPFVKRVASILWDEGKKGFAKFKSLVVSSTKAASKVLCFCLEKMKKVPSMLYTIWQKIKKWIVRFTTKVIWALRVTLAWTKILLRHSLSHLWD